MSQSPTILDVRRIAALQDPVLRNMQITQCYYELSQALSEKFGAVANWCTFAVWASRQAGVTIRGDDLGNKLEAELNQHRELGDVIRAIVQDVVAKHPLEAQQINAQIRAAVTKDGALRRASEAVALGNLSVFAEIAHEFARFLEAFPDATSLTNEKVDAFVQHLRPGDTAEGQQRLREAFVAYAYALRASDDVERAQAMLLANLLVGYHEQRRLQNQIRAALDCARPDLDQIRKDVLKAVLPRWWRRIRHRIMRLIGLKPPLDVLLDDMIGQLSRIIREVATSEMMELKLPHQTLRLGKDLRTNYPPALQNPTYQPLMEFIMVADAKAGTFERGPHDWSDFSYRMHYIARLFRSYQEDAHLMSPPFTDAELATRS